MWTEDGVKPNLRNKYLSFLTLKKR